MASRCSTAIARIGIWPADPEPLPSADGLSGASAGRVLPTATCSCTSRWTTRISSPSRPTCIPSTTASIASISRCKGPTDRWNRYFFATGAPGLIEAQTVVKGDDGVDRAASEPRIQAFWLQTSRGYHLEARLPLSLVGSRLWIEARSDGSGRQRRFRRRRIDARRTAVHDDARTRRAARHLHTARHPRDRRRCQCPEARRRPARSRSSMADEDAGATAPGTGASSPWTPPSGPCRSSCPTASTARA